MRLFHLVFVLLSCLGLSLPFAALAAEDPEATSDGASLAGVSGSAQDSAGTSGAALGSTESGGLFPSRLGPLSYPQLPAWLPSLSAQTCNACHGAIHDQWSSSGHSKASSNPVYRAVVAALDEPDLCEECHQPLLAQRSLLRMGPGAGATEEVVNPRWDPLLAGEGVTCVVCHLRDDQIVGPRRLQKGQAPHPVVAHDEMRGPEACSFCHQLSLPGNGQHPYIDTLGEWADSPHAEAGIVCQDCHMPKESGVIAGSRYAAFAGHRLTGDRRPEALARALSLDLTLSSPSIQRGDTLHAEASLTNTGAGHEVPSGDPGHRLELRIGVVDASGKPARGVETESLWLGRDVEDQPPFVERGNTSLAPGTRRSLGYRFSPSKKSRSGEWRMEVGVYWWSVPPERLKELGLERSEVIRKVVERSIPIDVR